MKTLAIAAVLGLWLSCCGCNIKPDPPWTDAGPAKSLRVNDPEESAAVTDMEKARANYKYRLEVLRAYYYKVGDLDKWKWADSEHKNLSAAKVFRWENIAEVVPPAGESLVNADERLLVELAVTARNAYIKGVDDLVKLYQGKRQTFKAQMIENMRDRLDPICLYPYFPDSMLPPKDLSPDAEIPDATRLYNQACKLFRDGKGWAHTFWSTSYEKERQACILFMKLIHEYPHSNKIALSAYYIADINKEYFKEYTLAVYWYKRAWTWDRNVPEPARFQAATVYDQHLHNYAEAVECYRLSMRFDPPRLLNYQFAEGRIRDLTGK